ncbi:MAG: YggS family pyridoxal phosphate-dependent enzyme [Dehalococcoidales bacterium]|nr:YggS family pyridoxal phosphate-dependent enzyme [Dehalococcoidales bacterium]MDD4794531.1 YggS family pyridoxal phosphate-dependent enzyme [Dehalococcoidales bacterium]MDD5122644.1 YggS family pyridoxal phosphate-dependent enzyme [Dehalococcoidales bacterium]MDD5498670.1 YggS family pyridoxal phosphate-dependent enzyme [Dehalococcoidales bacterium]
MSIEQNVKKLLSELGPEVQLVVAAKNRTPAEVSECISAGAKIIGQNYLQDARRAYQIIGEEATWHFIGRLQRNKITRIISMFDMIETLDSLEMASLVNHECSEMGRKMPVLVEVNSGREAQKSGVLPEELESFIKRLVSYDRIKVMGLMTMGPLSIEPEYYRPYFSITRKLFEHIDALNLPGVQMKYLSMGMTDSYRVAIEEGANIVRIGSKIFGPR